MLSKRTLGDKMSIKSMFRDALYKSVKDIVSNMPTGSEVDVNTLVSQQDEIIRKAAPLVENKYRGGFLSYFTKQNFNQHMYVAMRSLEKKGLLERAGNMKYITVGRMPKLNIKKWHTIILKRQTTLPAYDKKQIRRNLSKKNSNVFIAAKEEDKVTSQKELSRLSDALLKDLKNLNKRLIKKGKKPFTITSATGNAEWKLEPTFMLTNVPEEEMAKIHKLSKKYKQNSVAVSKKNESGASFVEPDGTVTVKFKTMVMDANAEYSTDFPTGQRLTFKKSETYSADDITFKTMSEKKAVKAFQDDDYFGYEKRSMRYGPNLSKDSKWATAPAKMFVAFDGETPVAVCGIAKYKGTLLGAGIHTRDEYKGRGLFGLCVKKVLSEKNGTIYINVANPRLVDSFRRRGFTDMQTSELPEDIQEELKGTKYEDQVQKWLKSNNTAGWFDMIKSNTIAKKRSKADMWWINFSNSIMQDEIPFTVKKDKKNNDLYVKYSNLGKANQEQVVWYLKHGEKNPKSRNVFFQNIKQEMSRKSDYRSHIEDGIRGGSND